MHRRNFLTLSSLGAGAVMMPAFLQTRALHPAADQCFRNLVIVHLQGGNDGLNTVIPYRSDAYYRKRPRLSIAPGEVIRLNDAFGLNPALRSLMDVYEKGQMLVLNDVGYRDVPASHYTASQYWESSLQQMIAGTVANDKNIAENNSHLNRIITSKDFGCFDESDFEDNLLNIATAIGNNTAGWIYKITLDGFDTHQFQRLKHDRLLQVYANGMHALMHILQTTGQLNRTLILTYSEFGRAVAENAKHGTEHGCANPVFIFGSKLKQAGITNTPSNLESSVMQYKIDVNNMLETIQKKWLCHPSNATTNSCMNWI